MASSRISLNTPDGKDVASAALALGKDVDGVVVVTLRFGGTGGRPSVAAEANMLLQDIDQRVLRLLGSASARLTGSELMALPAALLSLLYELDRDIYRRSEGLGPKTA